MTKIPVRIGNLEALIEKPEPDHCSAPWCKGEVVATCVHGVGSGATLRHCGAKLCAKHANRAPGGNVTRCPAHQRKADQEQGKVRMVP